MTERTNEEWLVDLRAEGAVYAQALEDLRERLRRGLYFYLSRDRSDLSDRSPDDINQMAEDFAQDALLKVLDNLHTFRGESLFTTWAAKIAVRVALSELRRVRWKDYSLETVTADGEFMPRLTDTPVAPASAPNPEEATERENVLALIDKAISEVLTERQRNALIAATIDGLPLPEVARLMDTNPNALYKLLHDARLKLRRHLESEGLSLDYVMDLFGGN
jgi:RNA polymerase sigma-70 factor (ECF subfamily)